MIYSEQMSKIQRLSPNIVADPFGALEPKRPQEIRFEKNNNTGLFCLICPLPLLHFSFKLIKLFISEEVKTKTLREKSVHVGRLCDRELGSPLVATQTNTRSCNASGQEIEPLIGAGAINVA